MTDIPVRGWKATYNMRCRNHLFEVGGIYEVGGPPVLCKHGFHFCLEQQEVLGHYNFSRDFILLEVEALGEVITEGDKSVTNKIEIIRVVPESELSFKSGNEIRYNRTDGSFWIKEYVNGLRIRESEYMAYSAATLLDKVFKYDSLGRLRRCEFSSIGGLWGVTDFNPDTGEIIYKSRSGVECTKVNGKWVRMWSPI